MNDMPRGSFNAIPFKITDPERIPAKRYYDEEFYRLENERLWPHVWQMAARLEEIPNVGDYVEYRNLDKSVIVVRTKHGVKAFHNACRHRGVELVVDRGNCKNTGFICPFHGWRWNMDGKNTFVFGRHVFSEDVLDKAEINLVPCRLETWGGSAFINFDDDAPALLECLGPVAERLAARNIDKLKMEWWYATELPTNWKLAMEAFMEGYHTMRTHPQINLANVNPFGLDAGLTPSSTAMDARESVDMMRNFLARLSSGMAGMIHASEVEIAQELGDMTLPDDPMAAIGAYMTRLKDEITKRGQARGLPVPDLNAIDAAHPVANVEYMFPHYFVLPFFGAMSSYRIRPLGPEKCLFEIWSLAFLPDDHVPPAAPTLLAHDSTDFPEIPQQDYSNLPRQQRGLHAGGFEYLRLSKDVEGLISNYQRLIDGYLGGEDPIELARGQQRVNDGYDHPIVEMAF